MNLAFGEVSQLFAQSIKYLSLWDFRSLDWGVMVILDFYISKSVFGNFDRKYKYWLFSFCYMLRFTST